MSSAQIDSFESIGYVMSGSRHKSMNAVRVRKENQVISAEEKRGILNLQKEEKGKRENQVRRCIPPVVATALTERRLWRRSGSWSTRDWRRRRQRLPQLREGTPTTRIDLTYPLAHAHPSSEEGDPGACNSLFVNPLLDKSHPRPESGGKHVLPLLHSNATPKSFRESQIQQEAVSSAHFALSLETGQHPAQSDDVEWIERLPGSRENKAGVAVDAVGSREGEDSETGVVRPPRRAEDSAGGR